MSLIIAARLGMDKILGIHFFICWLIVNSQKYALVIHGWS